MPDWGMPSDDERRDPDPFDWSEDQSPYPRRRGVRLVTKIFATVLIMALVLAFPLEYLLSEQLRNHHVEAVVAVTEVVIVVVLLAVVGSVRRRPR